MSTPFVPRPTVQASSTGFAQKGKAVVAVPTKQASASKSGKAVRVPVARPTQQASGSQKLGGSPGLKAHSHIVYRK